ncbi:MAG: hypothetical protein CYPHOPRED_005003 [Cyphobasidiales sp. Tagirdzhanova-0007]|nr:MAG: hypothetical protein CYPHOPRED_005003 [Cyphobasidiales sp. Tagirdzhanova-0007]
MPSIASENMMTSGQPGQIFTNETTYDMHCSKDHGLPNHACPFVVDGSKCTRKCNTRGNLKDHAKFKHRAHPSYSKFMEQEQQYMIYPDGTVQQASQIQFNSVNTSTETRNSRQGNSGQTNSGQGDSRHHPPNKVVKNQSTAGKPTAAAMQKTKDQMNMHNLLNR